MDIKDCPYAKLYDGVLMCMDYVIPCYQNVKRGKCGWNHMREMIDHKLQATFDREQFFERHFDRILYGGNLKYAPARHIVKGVKTYGNANLPRGGLRIKNIGEVEKKRPGHCRH